MPLRDCGCASQSLKYASAINVVLSIIFRLRHFPFFTIIVSLLPRNTRYHLQCILTFCISSILSSIYGILCRWWVAGGSLLKNVSNLLGQNSDQITDLRTPTPFTWTFTYGNAFNCSATPLTEILNYSVLLSGQTYPAQAPVTQIFSVSPGTLTLTYPNLTVTLFTPGQTLYMVYDAHSLTLLEYLTIDLR